MVAVLALLPSVGSEWICESAIRQHTPIQDCRYFSPESLEGARAGELRDVESLWDFSAFSPFRDFFNIIQWT